MFVNVEESDTYRDSRREEKREKMLNRSKSSIIQTQPPSKQTKPTI